MVQDFAKARLVLVGLDVSMLMELNATCFMFPPFSSSCIEKQSPLSLPFKVSPRLSINKLKNLHISPFSTPLPLRSLPQSFLIVTCTSISRAKVTSTCICTEGSSMARTRKSLAHTLLALSVFILLVVPTFAAETDKEEEKGKGNGNGNGNGNGKSKGKKPPLLDRASTNYVILDPNPTTGQERFFCLARGRCHWNTIECPAECAQRKPKKNKVQKGCFADCSSRCETTCKYRKPNCNGFGSICYDPRFVGGDGTMFYFHGAKGGNFALVSDDHLHINAHFIGTRPEGRTRDFTWVQALAVMFESHTLVIAARRVSVWDENTDALILRYDGKDVEVPTDGEAEWRAGSDDGSDEREVIIERTGEFNGVKVTVSGLVELDVKVTPISEEEDRMHGYRLPAGDVFAHLETQFKFKNLSERVEGVLGQTYKPDYVSPVKKGVAMPMMGGEDRYRTLGFLSTSCGSCRFQYEGTRMVDGGESRDVLVQQ